VPFGRPRISIDWHQFDKLCEMHATREEIASWFDCSLDTIDRACMREKKMTFAAYYKRFADRGRISLRRKMYEMAMEGNIPMLIWLSKQHLGHLNEPSVQIQVNQNVQQKPLSTEDLRDLASRYGYIDIQPKGENNAATRAIESEPIKNLPIVRELNSNEPIQRSDSNSGDTRNGSDSPESREDTRIRIPGYEDETR